MLVNDSMELSWFSDSTECDIGLGCAFLFSFIRVRFLRTERVVETAVLTTLRASSIALNKAPS
jgi:hypothetical protein